MIGKLKKMSSSEETQIKILEQSIMNNWQGIFELKEDFTEGTKDDDQWEKFRQRLKDRE